MKPEIKIERAKVKAAAKAVLRLQQCPGCKQELPKEAYFPSRWGSRGRNCRICNDVQAREWRSQNPEKLKVIYDRSNAKQATAKRNWSKMTRYGLTPQSFEDMLIRQHYKCLGCRRDISGDKLTNIDHNWSTGAVRGLLCHLCNMALGDVHDSKETLRRLMAYLDYDRTKLNIYIIGKLANPHIPTIGNAFREHGYDVFDCWHSAGEHGDDEWQRYSGERGLTFAEALKDKPAENVFYYDKAWIDLSDVGVLVMPGGKSSFLEMGYMRGCGKPVFMLLEGDLEGRYEVMPKFSSFLCTSVNEVLSKIHTHFMDTNLNAFTCSPHLRKTVKKV